MRDAAGRVFGPWGVAGSPGQGGVPNAFWIATPNVTLPAGTYTIIDSEPSTWSQNAQSGGRGIAAVKSYPTDSALVPTPQPTPNGTATQPKFYLVDLTPYGGKKGTATMLRDLLIDPSSWIRLKHHGEDGYSHPKMQLAISLPQVRGTTAIALAGHLDHAYLVPQGRTVVKMTVQTTQGDVVFEIQAGVHMSEWGAPQNHQVAPTGSGSPYVPIFSLPGPRTVTGLLFEGVELPKEMDQGSDAPGFCLLGITLVTP